MPQWPFSDRAGRGSDSLSFSVRVAGKAVTRAEKTKGTKPIGKIKLTPVTLSLCNWRNLNWISLTERCWHWEIAQTWEALAGQGKRWWGEEKKMKKSCPTYSLMCPPTSHSPISHCLREIMLPPPSPPRQPIWSLTVVHRGGLQFFNNVQLIQPDDALSTLPLLPQEQPCTMSLVERHLKAT